MPRTVIPAALAALTLGLAACAAPAAAPTTAPEPVAPPPTTVPAASPSAAVSVAPAVQVLPLEPGAQAYVGVPLSAAVLAADSDGVGSVVLTVNGSTVSTVPVDSPSTLYQGTLTWTPETTGANDLVVLVTDVNGTVTSAKWLTVQVLEAPASAPTAAPPPSGDTIPPAVSIELLASEISAGSDADVAVNAVDQGGVVKMELYAGDSLVETWQVDPAQGAAPVSAFYTFTYRDTPAGQYDVYVKATDSAGNVGQSNVERLDVN